MIRNGAKKYFPAEATDEKVAKIFIVIADGVRQCLICERMFSRSESFLHSQTICYPPVSNAN